MVSVPAAADIRRLLGFLSHFGDHRIAGDGGEEAVDVDRRKTLGKGDVLLWGEILVAKEDDTVLPEGTADLGERVGGNGSHEIDAGLSRHRHAVIPADPDKAIGHVKLPTMSNQR